MKRAMQDGIVVATVTVLALVILTALTLVGCALSDASPADMSTLYEEWQACMASADRASECMLEYDGDDNGNTPTDWHWCWRTSAVPITVLTPEETTLLWED